MAAKDVKAKESKLYALVYRYILADTKDITSECLKQGGQNPYPLRDTYDNYSVKSEKTDKSLESYATMSDESKQILGMFFTRVLAEFDQVTDLTAFDHVSIIKVPDTMEAEIRAANKDAAPANVVKLITAELYKKRMSEIIKVLEQYNDDLVASFMFAVNNSNVYKIQPDSTLDAASDPQEWVNAKIAVPLHRFKAHEVLVGTVARFVTEFLKSLAYLMSRGVWFARSHNVTKDDFLGIINQQGASFTLITELTDGVRVKVTKPKAKKAAATNVSDAKPADAKPADNATPVATPLTTPATPPAAPTTPATTPAAPTTPATTDAALAALSTADLGAFNAASLLGK